MYIPLPLPLHPVAPAISVLFSHLMETNLNHTSRITLEVLRFSSVRGIGANDSSQFGLPLVTIAQQFLCFTKSVNSSHYEGTGREKERGKKKKIRTLVVQQLLSRLGGVFSVGALDNGVDGARLLAEAAVDALGHVDIVAGRTARAIGTLFGLDGDGLGWADLEGKRGLALPPIAANGRQLESSIQRTASHSLQAMQRSSPEGYRRRACSPRNRGEMGP